MRPPARIVVLARLEMLARQLGDAAVPLGAYHPADSEVLVGFACGALDVVRELRSWKASEVCEACGGRGRLIDAACDGCNGTGRKLGGEVAA